MGSNAQCFYGRDVGREISKSRFVNPGNGSKNGEDDFMRQA